MDQLEHIWLLIHFYITCDNLINSAIYNLTLSFFFFRGRCTHRYTVITGCFPFSIMIAALPLVDFSTFFIDIGYISNWEKTNLLKDLPKMSDFFFYLSFCHSFFRIHVLSSRLLLRSFLLFPFLIILQYLQKIKRIIPIYVKKFL